MKTDDRWWVRQLKLENFRCFDDFTIEFDPHLTALVGINGTGKTAVLDALAVLLSTVVAELAEAGEGRRGFALDDVRLDAEFGTQTSVPTMEARFPVRGKIHARLGGEDYWWLRERLSKRGRTSWGEKSKIAPRVKEIWDEAVGENPALTLPVIALYGVERLVGVRAARGTIGKSRRHAYTAALDSKSDLTRLSSFIQGLTLDEYTARVEKGVQDPPEFRQLAAIRLACERVLERTGWTGPYWRQNVGALTMSHPEQGELPLSSLSSGLRIAAGLTIDLASRMARANPTLGHEELLNDVPGIVLIDEVDLHLHPTWQQQIVPSLCSAFPKVQFIITTHSPQVLSTVPASQIRILHGDNVSRVNYSEGLRSDVVLKEVLGTEPSPPVELTRELSRYLALVDDGQGNTALAMTLRRRLDEKLGGVEFVQSLAAADASMAFYDLDDE